MKSKQNDSVIGGDPVLDAAPDALITIDESGAILEFNTAAERTFGFKRSEALGRRVGDLLVSESQRPAHDAGLRRAVAGGASRIVGGRVGLSALRSDGREIIVQLFVTRTSEAPPRFTAWIRQLSGPRAPGALAHETSTLDDPDEEPTTVGSWTWTPSEGDLRWSDNVYRILGLAPGEVVPDPKVIVNLAHPDDRERVRTKLRDVGVAGEHPPVGYRIVRGDGQVRHLRTVVAVAERRDGEPFRLIGFVEDVTERVHARRAVAAHMAVAQAIRAWSSFEHGAQGLLAGLASALECQGGIVWLPHDADLVARTVWRGPAADGLDPLQRGARLRRGGGPAWRAHARHEVAVAPRAVAIPAVFEDDVLGVVELRSVERLELSERLVRSLTDIGGELGEFLGERRDQLGGPLLTPRELEVLALATRGLPAKRIAEHLAISSATVRTHFEHIYPKLGVSDRASAVAAAIRLGLIG